MWVKETDSTLLSSKTTRLGAIVIPAGVAHLVAAKNGNVIVQLSGPGKFDTNYLEE